MVSPPGSRLGCHPKITGRSPSSKKLHTSGRQKKNSRHPISLQRHVRIAQHRVLGKRTSRLVSNPVDTGFGIHLLYSTLCEFFKQPWNQETLGRIVTTRRRRLMTSPVFATPPDTSRIAFPEPLTLRKLQTIYSREHNHCGRKFACSHLI